MTPSERPHANKMQDHHLFWRKKEFRYAGKEANRLRHNRAFVIPVIGWRHDMLHKAIEPLSPPPPKICDIVYGVAMVEAADYDPIDRLDSIIGKVVTEAAYEPSPETADNIMQVAFHLVSQSAILRLGK